MSLWQEIEFWYFRKAQTVIWNVLEYKNLFLKSFPMSLCVLLLFLNKHSELIPDLFIFPICSFLLGWSPTSQQWIHPWSMFDYILSVLLSTCPRLSTANCHSKRIYLFISNLWRLQAIWLWPLILYSLEKDKFCS